MARSKLTTTATLGRPGKTVREIILEKVGRASGISRHDLRDRFDGKNGKRDEAMDVLGAMVREGVVKQFRRPPAGGQGQHSVSFFLREADGLAWVAEGNFRKRATPARRLSKPLADLTEQKAGNAWRNLAYKVSEGPAPVSAATKHTVYHSAPVFSRHQVPPGAEVPSVVTAADCRPWARHCVGE